MVELAEPLEVLDLNVNVLKAVVVFCVRER
jgi:hypothetical protein